MILLLFQRGKKKYKNLLKAQRSFWTYRFFALRILACVMYLCYTLYTLLYIHPGTHRDALLYTHSSQSSPAPIFHWSIGIQPHTSLQHSRWVTEPCQQPCSTWQDNFTVFCLNIVQWIWFLIQNNNGIWHSFNSTAILDGMEGFFFPF